MKPPTPTQRDVLEKMAGGAAIRNHGRGWFLDDGSGAVHGSIVNLLAKRGWLVAHRPEDPWRLVYYTISDAGRAALQEPR